MVHETFGDMLFTPTTESIKEFPSPDSLKRKIIISTKPPEEYPEAKETKSRRNVISLLFGLHKRMLGVYSQKEDAWGAEIPSFKSRSTAETKVIK